MAKKHGKYPKNFIKEIRESLGMTTRDVAKAAGPGWHNQTVSKLELSNQELTWSKLQTLAKVFQCHPLEITDGPEAISNAKTSREKEVLTLFRHMSEKQQDRFIGRLEQEVEDQTIEKQ